MSVKTEFELTQKEKMSILCRRKNGIILYCRNNFSHLSTGIRIQNIGSGAKFYPLIIW
jgi:hypothetical protein